MRLATGRCNLLSSWSRRASGRWKRPWVKSLHYHGLTPPKMPVLAHHVRHLRWRLHRQIRWCILPRKYRNSENSMRNLFPVNHTTSIMLKGKGTFLVYQMMFPMNRCRLMWSRSPMLQKKSPLQRKFLRHLLQKARVALHRKRCPAVKTVLHPIHRKEITLRHSQRIFPICREPIAVCN